MNWIKKAIKPKKKGLLHAQAARRGQLTKRGTIKVAWLRKQQSSRNTTAARRARLALDFRKFKKTKRISYKIVKNKGCGCGVR